MTILTPFARPHLFCEKIQRDDTDAAHNELWFIFKDFKLLVDQNIQVSLHKIRQSH